MMDAWPTVTGENFMGQKRGIHTRICSAEADRIRIRGRDLVDDLMGRTGFTAMFLLQALGREPTPAQVTLVDAVMVTIMEHGLVPSVVSTRLTYHGAPDSYQGAIAAGLLGVGDRFAGTAGLCGAIFRRVLELPAEKRHDAALAEIRAHRAQKRPLPGFGHPTHRQADPRVPRLLEIARQAGVQGEHIAVMGMFEQLLEQEIGHKLPTNISAAIAAVLGEAGIPVSMMRGVVLVARCAGLVGHLQEEIERPAAETMWHAIEQAVDYDPGDEK
jgi:citrate synthase